MKKYIFTKDTSLLAITKNDGSFGVGQPILFKKGDIVEGVTETFQVQCIVAPCPSGDTYLKFTTVKGDFKVLLSSPTAKVIQSVEEYKEQTDKNASSSATQPIINTNNVLLSIGVLAILSATFLYFFTKKK
jgi:hypothetical protein